MHAIFGDKLFDTNTAKRLAYWWNRKPSPVGYSESLYQNKAGDYFLACSGGSMSIYGEMDDNGKMRCGTKIVPLSVQEAQEWVKSHKLMN